MPVSMSDTTPLVRRGLTSFLVLLLCASAVALAPSNGSVSVAGPVFSDVPSGLYFSEGVAWLVDEEITKGTSPSTFSPYDFVTRGQMAAFLARYGQNMGGNPDHGFGDVFPSAYYDDPVAWLLGRGITTGTSATTYSPDDFVTRAQMAAFLWRMAGRPASTTAIPFTDVPDGRYFTVAVAWLVESGITIGTSATTFSPDDFVTRAQMAAFLWRMAGQPAGDSPGANRVDTDVASVTATPSAGTYSDDGGASVTIPGTTAKVGDLVVIPASDALPNGFPGRVISRDGDVLVLEPVPLRTVMPYVDVSAAIDLTDPAVMSRAGGPTPFIFGSLDCKTEGNLDFFDISLDHLSPTFHPELFWTPSTGVVIRLYLVVDVDMSTTVEGGMTGECEIPDGIPKLILPGFPVGPVVLVPELDWKTSISGSITAFEISGTAGFTLTIGVQSVDGDESAIFDFDPRGSIENVSLPFLGDGEVSIDLSTGPRLGLQAWGVAGVYFQVRYILRLDLRPGENPWWTVSVLAAPSVGVEISIEAPPFLSLFIDDVAIDFTLAEYETQPIVIASSGPPLWPGPDLSCSSTPYPQGHNVVCEVNNGMGSVDWGDGSSISVNPANCDVGGLGTVDCFQSVKNYYQSLGVHTITYTDLVGQVTDVDVNVICFAGGEAGPTYGNYPIIVPNSPSYCWVSENESWPGRPPYAV